MTKTKKRLTAIGLCLCFIAFGAGGLSAAPPHLIELSHWSEIREILPLAMPIRITDIGTGIVYYVASLSNGNHADVEPVTALDTMLLMQTFNWVETWESRPVWVTLGNRSFAAAIHSVAHDIYTIHDNGMDGHVCLHFFGSTTHASNAPAHLATVMQAFSEAAALPPITPPMPPEIIPPLLMPTETETPIVPVAPPGIPAVAAPSSHSVRINGDLVGFNAYNIGGNNFFRLRDVAFAINGTRSQFEVTWDPVMAVINLLPGLGYTPIGNEMAVAIGQTSAQALPNAAPVMVAGVAVNLRAYNIGGYTYFMLRDLGAALGFTVDWDEVGRTILIDTQR